MCYWSTEVIVDKILYKMFTTCLEKSSKKFRYYIFVTCYLFQNKLIEHSETSQVASL